MTPTAQALAEIVALAELATSGEWRCFANSHYWEIARDNECIGDVCASKHLFDGIDNGEANAAVIVAAVNFIRTHGPALLAQLGGGREVVAFRYLHEIARGTYAMTRWLDIKELVHYGPDGDIKLGPHPDWTKIEYAYATPTEPAQAGRDGGGE